MIRRPSPAETIKSNSQNCVWPVILFVYRTPSSPALVRHDEVCHSPTQACDYSRNGVMPALSPRQSCLLLTGRSHVRPARTPSERLPRQNTGTWSSRSLLRSRTLPSSRLHGPFPRAPETASRLQDPNAAERPTSRQGPPRPWYSGHRPEGNVRMHCCR